MYRCLSHLKVQYWLIRYVSICYHDWFKNKHKLYIYVRGDIAIMLFGISE